MAIFHSSAKILTRSSGHHALKASAYRCGQRLSCSVSGETFDFSRKRHVGPSWIQAPAGSPPWTLTRASLWSAAELAEKRVNSQLAREIEVALLAEWDAQTEQRVLREYVEENFVRMGMAADVSIHTNPGNRHAHIMLTLRTIEADGFGAKRREWNDAKLVVAWRESWAAMCNQSLTAMGSSERIDHRSNAERGIPEAPTVHVGRSKSTSPAEVAYRLALNAWRRTNRALRLVKAELGELRERLHALSATGPVRESMSEDVLPSAASTHSEEAIAADPPLFKRGLKHLIARSLQPPPKTIRPQQADGNSPNRHGGFDAVSSN